MTCTKPHVEKFVSGMFESDINGIALQICQFFLKWRWFQMGNSWKLVESNLLLRKCCSQVEEAGVGRITEELMCLIFK